MCLSVCLSAAACLHYCTDPDVTWGSGRGCPLVVHYWADLQSGHEFVTDGVAWSVGRSVGLSSATIVSSAKRPNGSRCCLGYADSGGPKGPCIRCGSKSQWEGAILRGKGRPIVKHRE